MNNNMNDEIVTGMNGNAVKVYESDDNMVDDFPVLKAFQQYVDEEQAKARRRILGISVFFCFLLLIVVAVFVVLLVLSNSRNQILNDRLIEYAMKDRERKEPVVVQQQTPDNRALMVLTQEMQDLKTKIAEDHVRAEQTARELAKKESEASKKEQAAQALEIERLKALLASEKEKAEKEKAAAEREKQRQAELEAYRRKHYPECYGKKSEADAVKSKADVLKEAEAADREIESILRDIKPIEYFDDEGTKDKPEQKNVTKSPENAVQKPEEKPLPFEAASSKKPKDIKDEVGNAWEIPLE